MSTSFQNKVIAVTGGASGIGLATCKLLSSRGAILSVADVQTEALAATASEIEAMGGKVLTAVVDVSSRPQIEAWIAATVAKFGKLDGVANIAGVMGKQTSVASIVELDDADWGRVLDINVTGLMYCLRAQIPNLKSKASIVNTTSILGLTGMPKNAAYVTSKHAIIGLTRTAAREFGCSGIRVNCVAPGPIDTPLFRANAPKDSSAALVGAQALGRMGESSEVAEAIAWLLSENSSFVTGTVQVVDGGLIC